MERVMRSSTKLGFCRSILLFRLSRYGTLPDRQIITGLMSESDECSTTQLSRHKIVEKQNDLLSRLKSKIMSAKVPRIEKIEIQYKGRNISDDAMMLMNKMLSTPYQCAMHVSKNLADDSILALVKKRDTPDHQAGVIVEVKNEEPVENTDADSPSTEIITVAEKSESEWTPWDMHRPLEYDCELKLLNFDMNLPSLVESQAVNRAYWKSCALILGAVAQEVFEDNLEVEVAHLPNVSEKNGAFCYDVQLSKDLLHSDGTPKWNVDESVLIALTKAVRNILSQNLRFEHLEVHKDDAVKLFKHNEHQLRRIEKDIFLTVTPSYIPVYRFGKYIDICDGPLVPSTDAMYHFVVTAVHQLRCSNPDRTATCLWRFQGLSLPKKLQVHHAVWAMLEHRARKLVRKDLPFSIMESNTHNFDVSLHKYRSIENETKKYNMATGQWLEDKWDLSSAKVKVPTT